MLDECAKFGAQQVDSIKFYNMVRDVIIADALGQKSLKSGDLEQLQKYENVDTDWLYDEQTATDRKAVDLLMSQASLQADNKNIESAEDVVSDRKKGNPHRQSKENRELNRILKKLR